jgi:hypothetical protein
MSDVTCVGCNESFVATLNAGERHTDLVAVVRDAVFAWDHAETSDLPEPGGDRCPFDFVIEALRDLLAKEPT